MCENCDIDTLVIASVSSDQMPLLSQELNEKHFYFTNIDSSGGFLYSATNTLLIGIRRERYDELMDILHTCCQRRCTHILSQTQMETYNYISQPVIIEAETGGAILHTLTVEHFEQF